jgi:hypothetical protein
LPNVTSQITCPTERQWDELAAGLIRDEQAMDMTGHAATCERCASLLRASLDIFQEEGQISAMAPPNEPIIMDRRPRWIPMSIAATLIAGLGVLQIVRNRNESDPLRQLAEAYAENRTMEFRIPDASFGPPHTTRGPGSRADLTKRLLEVEAQIGRHLEGNPRNALWLHAKGRLLLLENHPREAVEALNDSRRANPNPPSLWIDLASAEAQLAVVQGDRTLLLDALGLLDRAVQADSGKATALFNRALVLEQLGRKQEAIGSLERLLTIEPSPPWSEESRRILARLKSPNPQHTNH